MADRTDSPTPALARFCDTVDAVRSVFRSPSERYLAVDDMFMSAIENEDWVDETLLDALRANSATLREIAAQLAPRREPVAVEHLRSLQSA